MGKRMILPEIINQLFKCLYVIIMDQGEVLPFRFCCVAQRVLYNQLQQKTNQMIVMHIPGDSEHFKPFLICKLFIKLLIFNLLLYFVITSILTGYGKRKSNYYY